MRAFLVEPFLRINGTWTVTTPAPPKEDHDASREVGGRFWIPRVAETLFISRDGRTRPGNCSFPLEA
jgi:hypothetical protein